MGKGAERCFWPIAKTHSKTNLHQILSPNRKTISTNVLKLFVIQMIRCPGLLVASNILFYYSNLSCIFGLNLFFMGHSRHLLLYFWFFNTVDGKKCCLYKRWSVPMNGFEPRTSSVRSNRSTHWAITTALGLKLFAANALIERILKHFLKNNFSGPTTAPPSLSTPDLLYHHHHVSHSTLPLPSHHSHNHNNSQLNHATAAATLNRDQY